MSPPTEPFDPPARLQDAIVRCTNSARRSPNLLTDPPISLRGDDVIVNRSDLDVLLAAAAWRLGYIEGAAAGRLRDG